MINMNERVRNLFAHDIQSKIALVDTLSDPIAQAAQSLVTCLLADGKIFIGGQGGSAANCLHFSTAMLHCFEVERPSLPVINLASNGALAPFMNDHSHSDHMLSQQVKALGHPQDALVLLTTAKRSKALANVLTAAHEKQMQVIALTGRDGGGLAQQLHSQDIELRIPEASSARIREMHLFILHCFCDVIDSALFGYDPN